MTPKIRRFGPRTKVAALTLTVAAIAIALTAFDPPVAFAGRYEVVQCDRSNRAFTDAHFDRVNGGDYGFLYRCEDDEDANSLQIRPITTSPQGRYGQISWDAPAGARIVGVDLEARMRSDAGHQARLSFLDAAGNEVGRIATGTDVASSFESYQRQLTDGGRQRFAASLTCTDRNGCPNSEQARNWIRSIDLTIDDRTPPVVVAGGSLSSAGWKRGEGTIGAAATDTGSGVRSFEFRVNGAVVAPSQTLGCALIPGSPRASRIQPCPSGYMVQAAANTGAVPFVNGVNVVRVCATDYGSGAVPGCVSQDVMVDNAPPELAFANSRDPEDPELIRAPVVDRHSGLVSGSIAYRPLAGGAWRELPTEIAGGELRARVDSTTEPRGRYVFRAIAADAVGNQSVTTLRADGGDMILEFPLREGTDLDAAIGGKVGAQVGYGSRPELQAVLSDAAGHPLAGRQVEVVERFVAGSSLEPIGRSVSTDEHGRISVALSKGPSRTIGLAFSGTPRYLPSLSDEVTLAVRGKASLRSLPKNVRAGRRVRFSGSIGAYGAAMPKGKLVELQVQGGGVPRYRTIRKAFRTDSNGKWQMRYRFDRFYQSPTRFRFRLKLSRELSWPYLTPAFSKIRVLTVKPKR